MNTDYFTARNAEKRKNRAGRSSWRSLCSLRLNPFAPQASTNFHMSKQSEQRTPSPPLPPVKFLYASFSDLCPLWLCLLPQRTRASGHGQCFPAIEPVESPSVWQALANDQPKADQLLEHPSDATDGLRCPSLRQPCNAFQRVLRIGMRRQILQNVLRQVGTLLQIHPFLGSLRERIRRILVGRRDQATHLCCPNK